MFRIVARTVLFVTLVLLVSRDLRAQEAPVARNPIIHSDVPDMAVIRVGDTYYMSSTTMYFSPGVPIMRSKDLVNWDIVNYAYQTLGDADHLALNNGKNNYGRGSWASSIRHHNGTFYVTTFSLATNKTYIFATDDIEKGPWRTSVIDRVMHDHTLVFDTDGRVYMIYGGGTLRVIELNADVTGIKPGGVDQVLTQDPSAVAGANMGLKAEGSQLIVHDGKYYLFNICWPRGGTRTVIVHRADRLLGPYEGRVALQDMGVAQGSLIDTPDGRWFAYLFQDSGAVGRIPWLVPVEWKDGWPIFGIDGKAPVALAGLPANKGPIPGIVASDEFDRQPGDRSLPLVWQWNHNPADGLWSFSTRPGFLRLSTDRTDAGLFSARNTLTQRTFGPTCSGITCIDVSNMNDGDLAGLSIFHATYGLVGVRADGGKKFVVMGHGKATTPEFLESVALEPSQTTVYLRADCDYRNRADTARFYFSFDGTTWKPIGRPVKLVFSLAHFVGNRFGLFYYSTGTPGGIVDFDFFRVTADSLPASADAGSRGVREGASKAK